MAQERVSASVVVEWYNLTYAELGRTKDMLAEVTSQATSLCRTDASSPTGLSGPLELVIAFDESRLTEQQVRSSLPDSVAGSDHLIPRFLAVPAANYCKMKNAGAAITNGEILIFLDCDVIPEPNWLAALLGAFTDPSVSVVVGNTYVDCSDGGTYSRSMALTWMFPLRDLDDRLNRATWFYANNVAFRRQIFLSRQFPDTPGLIHAPAALLVERLNRDGIDIWHAGGARASHPPPNGLLHFAKRAIAGGRARSLSRPSVADWPLIHWVRSDIGSIT